MVGFCVRVVCAACQACIAKADDQAPALQACQGALHSDMLGVQAKSIAIIVGLDPVDVASNRVSGRPQRARILALLNSPQARRLHPSTAPAHVDPH
jgi:hypothetical protein